MARPELLKASSTEVIWWNPQQGRPSSTPSVTLLQRNGSDSTLTAAATTSVTQDTVNTTLSGNASEGDREVTLTAVTGLEIRRSYLITNTLSQTEWVRVRSINASTKVVETDEPLEHAHAATSTFLGTGFYRTLSATETATLGEMYRARATYTIDSVSYTTDVPFDVVLVPLTNPLSVEFVKKRRADIMSQQHAETRGDDYQDYREAAWEDGVLQGIRSHKDLWRPGLLKSPSDVEGWALAEFDLICSQNGIDVLKGIDPLDALEKLEQRAANKAAAALSSLDWMDEDDDDNRDASEQQPKRMDFMR
ncbi:MAG: hypothetical protein GY835_23950 [bacterium]|nr:hypothetical protein [bacterium]